MTAIEGKLCSAILREHFSDIVQKVGYCLFRNGRQSLQFIRTSTKLPLDEIKKCLCLLIKFGFVLHEKNDKDLMTYKLDHNAVIMTLRYPKFMHLVKLNSGDEAEIMLEEILKQGYELASQIIIKTQQRILEKTKQEPTFPSLVKAFELLTKNEYIMRCTASHECAQPVPFKPDYSLPKLNLNALEKIARGEQSDTGDAGVYWRVNFDRFVQDLRDELVVKSARDKIDDMAGELMRQLLILSYQRTSGWESTLNPVPLSEIREQVRKHSTQPRLGQYLEQYMRILEDEFSSDYDIKQVLKRVGDSSGGQYSIDVKEAFAQLAESTLHSIVRERYGSNAGRVFSVILSYPHIKIEKLQSLMMINPKESKMLTFQLLYANYIHLEELREPKASLASPSTYLCSIDMNSVVRMEIGNCFQAIYNMNQRRNHETISNKRVIDKYLRLQAIKNNMIASGAEEEKVNEIDEMMTPAEYQELERTNIKIKVLAGAELKAEETLFILSMYLRYH